MEKGLQKERKLRISILGDSISTFAGYTPKDSVFYDSYVQWETGVKTVEDTWWMQVIRAFDAELGINNSVAGSMVSGNLSTSAMAEERIQALGENGLPDLILVSAGCNDWGFCVLPEEFESAYQTMLCRLKNIHMHRYGAAPFRREKSRKEKCSLISMERYQKEFILILYETVYRRQKCIWRIQKSIRKNMKQQMEYIQIKKE